MKCPHRAFDVLQRESTKVAELCTYTIDHGVVSTGGDNNSAGLGDSFKPSRNVHTVAKNVVVFDYDVTNIDPDAKLQTLIPRYGDIALAHAALDVHSAAGSVNDAGKLDQIAITGGLDDASPILSNFRIDKFTPIGHERGKRAFLVGTHQPAVACNIGCQDGSQPSFDTRLRHKKRPDLSIVIWS